MAPESEFDRLAVSRARLWRRLAALAAVGARADGGVCREALTPEDKAGRDLFASWCAELEMTVAVDALGTMFATYAGMEPELPAVAVGSHLDTQPFGGKFDGALGVLAGFEMIETLREAGVRTRRPLTVVNWTAEEGCRFTPSMAASGVYAGVFAPDAPAAWRDADGVGFLEALSAIGYAGDEPVGARRFAAFLELHIEQGPVLEEAGALIGVVTGAQAMSFNRVRIEGREAHAGPTPMAARRDPVQAMLRILSACFAAAEALPDGRCTVGALDTEPRSHSSVPRRVELLLDLRHPSAEGLAQLIAAFDAAAAAERARGFAVARAEFGAAAPCVFDPVCVDAVRAAAAHFGYAAREIVSGAGHDAVYVAEVCPTAMVFCPCAGGVSHHPDESITPEEAEAGANVLMRAAVALANAP